MGDSDAGLNVCVCVLVYLPKLESGTLHPISGGRAVKCVENESL